MTATSTPSPVCPMAWATFAFDDITPLERAVSASSSACVGISRGGMTGGGADTGGGAELTPPPPPQAASPAALADSITVRKKVRVFNAIPGLLPRPDDGAGVSFVKRLA